MDVLSVVLFGIVVLATHFMEGITGFGCTVLALPFCIALAGINVAVPVLIVLAWLLCFYIVVIDFKKIIWKEYIKIISFVILGLPIGMWLFTSMPEKVLKTMLGVFMIVVALRGLYISYGSKHEKTNANNDMNKMTKVKKYLLNVLLFLGGLCTGLLVQAVPLW